MKQAVILAGGQGSRLRERLGDLPKPLIDLCGVPLLERQVILAREHGISSVLILVNYAAQRIIDFCSSRENWGIDVRCIDDGEPRGTAGATLAAYGELADEFLVIYGDTMLAVDLGRMFSFHRQAGHAAATLLLHPNDHPHDSDLVEMDQAGRIAAFHPYPHDPWRYYPNLVNAALYCLRKEALQPWRNTEGVFDFGKHLFPAMLGRGLPLRGYVSPEYIKDIGTPARLDKVSDDFRSGKLQRSSLKYEQPIVFMDRDGTLNREVQHLSNAQQLEVLPGVPEAIRRLNRSEYRCCVVTNQPVVARGDCSPEELRRIHNKLETLLGRGGAFLDRIYYCPHHPDRGFPGERAELKIDCDCRKPKTGLIERALEDFNGAADRSWMVGDTSTDIETAHRAGLRSILVETGYAGLDYRSWATPDAIVPDLTAAVSFILDTYPALLSRCRAIASAIHLGAIVLIGGQSRSGKSTFAAVLRDALASMGKHAVVMPTDRWLLSEPRRAPGVLGRYDIPALQAFVDSLIDEQRRPTLVALAGYDKLRRETVPNVETLPLTKSDIVVLEGTVALGLSTKGAGETHRFHVDIDEQERKERVLREYRLRGFDSDSAAKVYAARCQDEVPVIQSLASNATRISVRP